MLKRDIEEKGLYIKKLEDELKEKDSEIKKLENRYDKSKRGKKVSEDGVNHGPKSRR